MKKILFVMCFSIFNTTFSNNVIKHPTELIQERSIQASIYVRGQWYNGSIKYVQHQQGYTLLSYSFPSLEIPGQGQFSGSLSNSSRFIALNPNNDFAKNYNFTHYVEIMGLRAYITG